ncbi:hypothetical protein ACFPVT_02730 [Corynebacterium choanae]|nr:hypothetical protein [Corynebacterium choanae]
MTKAANTTSWWYRAWHTDLGVWRSTIIGSVLGAVILGLIVGWFRPTYLVTPGEQGEFRVIDDPLTQPEFTATVWCVLLASILAVAIAGHLWFWAAVRPVMPLRIVVLGLFATLLIVTCAQIGSELHYPLPDITDLAPTAEVAVAAPFQIGLGSYFVAGSIGGLVYLLLVALVGESPRVVRRHAGEESATPPQILAETSPAATNATPRTSAVQG